MSRLSRRRRATSAGDRRASAKHSRYEVLQAPNGATALSLLKEQTTPLDVIVTDVVMPELSGPDLARAACNIDPTLGIVFMSGYPESMQSARPGEFEEAAFLAKPFAPQKLVDAVRDRVERRRTRAQPDL